MRSIRGRPYLLSPIIFLVLIYAIPLPTGLSPPYSKVVRFRDRSVMRIYLTPDEQYRIFLPLSSIDPLLIEATIQYEDRYFWFHPGFNPISLIRALYQNIRAGRIVSGGSTITMQLARIIEPKPRTVISKIIEIFRAVQFELRLGKPKILESYLNLAPYGGNVEGVGAAALGYYGRLPQDLTAPEIAFLVSLPQSPALRRPGPLSSKQGRDQVLSRMLERGLIDESEYQDGLKASVPTQFRPFPFHAPHICDFLMMKYSDKRDITSTIDPEIQEKVENITRSYKKRIYEYGATNLSVVVFENRTRKLRGVVGSIDYFDEEHSGQVRGFYAFRSPGSTLKPFLYILAIEAGLINPESLIEDAPYKFGDFEPTNYLNIWRGLVRAEDALSLSLNLPFILILRRYGYDRFVWRLKKAGLDGPLSYDQYGLPIITGGMDVRLLDLTNLYLTLARGGMHGRYLLLEGETADEKRLFPAGAVLLTLKALSKRDRPDAPNLKTCAMPKGRVCWKTGTSFGRRDAWSIGFQKEYTVGVWVGNFSGEGSDSIVGATLAGPIMFDIIRSLENPGDSRFDWGWQAKADLESIPVCAFSGYKPGPNCPEIKMALALKNHHTMVECPFHKRFLVEKKTGYRANPYRHYQPGELTEKTFLVFPAPVQRILKHGKPPEFSPDFRIVEKKASLRITSPVDRAVYLIPKGVRWSSYIPLQAFTGAGNDSIFWFVNGVYLGATRSGEILELKPEDRNLAITGQDGSGTAQTINITVEWE
ncbi:MAG TPA: penicillin-binding protein 1C [bacterium (Candidatus Stahlbacteria)]|nr:penicillin-binding protein 1C [Candidatus Stahlbacteria bacterium]